jgi:hypothetical protein
MVVSNIRKRRAVDSLLVKNKSARTARSEIESVQYGLIA